MWAALAAVPPPGDPISGGAGWVGAGLLGLVLGWLLLVHLPSKDKQLKELIDAQDKQVGVLVEKFEKALADTRGEFRDALDRISERHERQVNAMIDALRSEFAAVYDRAMVFATRHGLIEAPKQ